MASETAAPAATEAAAPESDEHVVENTVVVSNIAPALERKQLQDLFRCCGAIDKLELVALPSGERHCIIEYKQAAHAKAAEFLSNTPLGDRNLVVKAYSDHKKNVSDGTAAAIAKASAAAKAMKAAAAVANAVGATTPAATSVGAPAVPPVPPAAAAMGVTVTASVVPAPTPAVPGTYTAVLM